MSQTILRLLARLKDLLTDKTTKDEDKGASYVMKLCVYFWCITPMDFQNMFLVGR